MIDELLPERPAGGDKWKRGDEIPLLPWRGKNGTWSEGSRGTGVVLRWAANGRRVPCPDVDASVIVPLVRRFFAFGNLPNAVSACR